ncbi:hypothetical protein [Halalkalicoccus sp. NIPERK01]|uniref:hypothetical protein n=1 Tax=Halalkalicoccus sp. NIPERK01 TaxID=3053469 RepID=UPI00256EF156|nr:hypothetical protein [Halalkalicoccus sp. NIPERK01]MDL5362881.1 hypothetical protein [Halalkalicoccus sp. NIPERK01]
MVTVPQSIRDRLESLPHVVGTGVGKKRVDGRKTDETCVVVFVDRKLPEAQLAEEERVPRTVDCDGETLPTDVQQVGDVSIQAVPAVDRQSERTDRHRPAPPGVSIAHPAVSAGTLGSPVLETEDGDRVILTNAHVAAPIGEADEGDPILQPGPADGGEPPEGWRSSSDRESDGGEEGDEIGTLAAWSEISSEEPNAVDSALVEVDPDDIDPEILGIGPLAGFAEPDLDSEEEYVKSGRTTGVTTGDLRGRDARIRVGGYYDEPVVFEGVDVFGPMSAGGDSGSLIGVQDEGFYATDLLFAGSDESTIGVPIGVAEAEHGELRPVEGGDDGSGDDGSGDFRSRVRERLETEYGSVEDEGEAFRVDAWPLSLTVIATTDLGAGIERAREVAGDAVVLAVPAGTETEIPSIPAGIAVVPVDP